MNTFQTVFEQQKRRRSDPDARYLDPTALYPVSWKDLIMDEVFGPILPIVTYRTLDEAFDRISAAPSPLTAFISVVTGARSIGSLVNSLSAVAL
jgi:acyl-CoA reductase-like NAD-dependent aldehyde dehydrogenase